MASLLFTVSWNSASGSESFTHLPLESTGGRGANGDSKCKPTPACFASESANAGVFGRMRRLSFLRALLFSQSAEAQV